MAKILITTGDGEVIETQGKMTFETIKKEDEHGDIYFETIGQLAIHEYIVDIDKIESARYLLENVDVYREVYGTDDFNILYEFQVNNYGWDIKEDYLSEETIKAIEKEEYKNDEGDYYMTLDRGDK